jgi:hypothetical protein
VCGVVCLARLRDREESNDVESRNLRTQFCGEVETSYL